MQFEGIEKVGTEESYLTIKLAGITAMSFLGINYGVIMLLWFFMLSDTVLGIWASVVVDGWDEVTKTKFVAGVLSKLAVLFLPLSVALSGALLGFNFNIFVMTVMYALIANDAISCYTNLLSIRKNKRFVNKDLIELLINSLRSLIFNSAKSAINRLKNSDMCNFDQDEDEDKQ